MKMIHILSMLEKESFNIIFFKDWWEYIKDPTGIVRLIRNYAPFIRKTGNKFNTIRIESEKMKLVFGNYEEIILIFGASKEDELFTLIERMDRIYKTLKAVYPDNLNELKKLDAKFSTVNDEADLVIRSSATLNELRLLDETVEQRQDATLPDQQSRRIQVLSPPHTLDLPRG